MDSVVAWNETPPERNNRRGNKMNELNKKKRKKIKERVMEFLY